MIEPMTDATFEELLGANPLSQDPAFLAAARATPAREAAWQAACAFEKRLRASLEAVQAPATLLPRLLAAVGAEPAAPVMLRPPRASTGDWLRRYLPVAAVLLLALGMNWYFQFDGLQALQDDILGHIYDEAPYIPESAQVALDDVNAHLELSLGAHLASSAATRKLRVTFVKDCKVAKQVGTHLVVKGAQGPVNVIMLPSQVVEHETAIADAHLQGKMTPSSGHTLVVVGDKQEPIDEYLRVFDSNLEWEY